MQGTPREVTGEYHAAFLLCVVRYGIAVLSVLLIRTAEGNQAVGL